MTSLEPGGLMGNPRPSRRGPLEPVRIHIAFDGTEDLSDDSQTGPMELTLEPTNVEGELAHWLRDDFWTDVINRLADRPCTIHFLPTVGAALHPVILHQVEMLHRVTPSWRSVAHAYAEDFGTDEDVRHIAGSAYSELRILDGRRPGSPASDLPTHTRSVEDLFGEIRRRQNGLGATTPVLVRLCSPHPEPLPQTSTDRSRAAPASHSEQI